MTAGLSDLAESQANVFEKFRAVGLSSVACKFVRHLKTLPAHEWTVGPNERPLLVNLQETSCRKRRPFQRLNELLWLRVSVFHLAEIIK